MISVRNPAVIPLVLRTRGAVATQNLCALYDQGSRHFNFSSSVYGHSTVKRSLGAAQHYKCCYCEAKFLHSSFGDIDHFRPKGGHRQDETQQLQQPGYYWLAYSIDNLLFTCEACNRSYKRTFFPLSDPASRANSHNSDLGAESPLIINPRVQNPGAYISFRGEYPYAINGNEMGVTTIKVLGLDREYLNEDRREHLLLVKSLWLVARGNIPESGEARRELKRMKSDKAQYAAASRALLEKLQAA